MKKKQSKMRRSEEIDLMLKIWFKIWSFAFRLPLDGDTKWYQTSQRNGLAKVKSEAAITMVNS